MKEFLESTDLTILEGCLIMAFAVWVVYDIVFRTGNK